MILAAPARPWSSGRLVALAVGLAVAAAAAATAGVIAVAQGETRAQTTGIALATIAAGCSFVAAGTIALLTRAEKHTGGLMTLAGFVLLGASTAQSSHALPFTLGLVVVSLPAALLAHLVLRFPDDRLHSRSEQIVVALAYLDVTVVQVAMLMFMGFEHVRGCPCPENLLFVRDDARVHGALMTGERAIGLVVVGWGVVLVVRRWLRASGPLRRAVTPLLATGTVWLALLGLTLVTANVSTRLTLGFATAERIALAAVPFAFLFGLLEARLARGSVSDLMVELDRLDTPGRLRDALARALRDPSLELAYWLPEAGTYAGIDGQPVDVAPSATRAVTELERGGRRIAALVHDPAVGENAALLEAVSTAAGMTLENERLQAELRAQLEELRESRARIVAAGDTARRALERNLHDGAQQRLVSLSVGLALAQERLADDPAGAASLIAAAKDELAAALQELRELARGLHPAILHRGVQPALSALAERSPVPVELAAAVERELPPTVAATIYYVVAEALTNVARYAGATRATVRVDAGPTGVELEVADDGRGGAAIAPGSGLEGLRDRVEAIGGRLRVRSAPGEGTVVSAWLPLDAPAA